MDYHRAIARYYQAYRDRDRQTLRSLLTASFHFVSSFAEYRGRDAMLEEIWPAVGQAWATKLRIFGHGPELVVLYEHENAPGEKRPGMSMAEYIRFEGDRIAEIEVFQGRPIVSEASEEECDD
ncbi:MAG TPA: nuclear transport factor 2 family protein [Steroidobacteraceae bacterium]|nr:nuclear transport factor 2 family protein [Steroidobacteraceae bacterium]